MAPGDRPLSPQRVCGCRPLSYGDYTDHSPVCSCGGLDGVLGCSGRLPPGFNSSIFSPVPEVLRRGTRFTSSARSVLACRRLLRCSPASWPLSLAIMHRHGFRILRYLEGFQIRLLPQFIPGKLNVLADSLSCRSQVIGSDWTLCSEVFRQLLRQWPATIDLFATSLNARLPVYFSPAGLYSKDFHHFLVLYATIFKLSCSLQNILYATIFKLSCSLQNTF